MRHPLLQPFFIILACSTSACASRSGSDNLSYPAAYRAALIETQQSAPVREEDLELFIKFLESIGTPGSAQAASELYSENIHFSDALILTTEKQVIVKHFSDLEAAGNKVKVTMHQKILSGNDIFLVWSMEARFTPIRKEMISDSLGVTHLRFDENGRVILHQDFWDSTEGFFRHIPVLGSVVNSVKRRVAN
jgi:hypothetical protein